MRSIPFSDYAQMMVNWLDLERDSRGRHVYLPWWDVSPVKPSVVKGHVLVQGSRGPWRKAKVMEADGVVWAVEPSSAEGWARTEKDLVVRAKALKRIQELMTETPPTKVREQFARSSRPGERGRVYQEVVWVKPAPGLVVPINGWPEAVWSLPEFPPIMPIFPIDRQNAVLEEAGHDYMLHGTSLYWHSRNLYPKGGGWALLEYSTPRRF